MAGTIGTAYIAVAPNMSGVQGKIASGLRGSGQAFAEQFGGEISGRSALVIGALAGVAQAATTKAMNLISQSFGDAVSRVDTLARFPTVMANLGYSARDAAGEVSRIAKSLIGLPTSLDQLTTFVQRIAPVSGGLKQATDIALAFNNAVLAGGGPTYRQADAIEQFAQMLSKGKPDMMAWRTLQEAMPATLSQIAKQLGITSGNTLELYDALMDGKISFQQFTGAVVSLNDKGLPGFKNFSDQAKDATVGIATGMQNAKTAITRGLAAILTAIGQKNISNAIADIGKGFEQVLKLVATAIPIAVAGVKSFFEYVNRNKDIFYPIAVGIGAIVAAITAWKTALLIWSGITKVATAAQAAFNAVMAINPVTAIALAIVGLVAGLTYFFTKTETGKKVWSDFTSFLTGALATIKGGLSAVGDFFVSVWGKIMTGVWAVRDAFNAVTGAVSNFVSAGINVLNSALQATIGWFQQNYKWFENIGIIIGTILLPKMVALGIEAVKTAAKWVASMAQAGASTATTAAQAVLNFIKMSVSATIEAAKSAAAWTLAAGQAALAWLKTVPGMIVGFVQASAASVVNAVKSGAAWVLSAGQTLVAWGTTFAGYLAGVALAAAQTLLAGARMAAGWMLAMGPIGLIVAAVVGAVALIIANWDKIGPFFASLWNGIKNAVAAVVGWITQNWPLLLAIITGPIGLAVLYVSRHWDSIKQGAANAIGGIISFFGGLPGRILGAVGNLGGILYNHGRDMIQGLLNGAGSLLSKIGSFFLDKLPGWIQGPFKKALGIHSPSKVFAGFGGNITEGLARGLDDGRSMVNKAVSSMANEAMSAFAGTDMSAAMNVGSAGVGGFAPAAGTVSTTNQDVAIGTVVLGDKSAAQEFFKQLNQDTINVGMGLTPVEGAY